MAEFIMKDLVKKAGAEHEFYIESAGTSNEEEGNPVYPPVKKLLSHYNITCGGKTARKMTRADYDRFDLIIAMDYSNLRGIDRITGGDRDNKIHLLLSYAGEQRAISDPWYTRNFEAARQDILLGCTALLNTLTRSE